MQGLTWNLQESRVNHRSSFKGTYRAGKRQALGWYMVHEPELSLSDAPQKPGLRGLVSSIRPNTPPN